VAKKYICRESINVWLHGALFFNYLKGIHYSPCHVNGVFFLFFFCLHKLKIQLQDVNGVLMRIVQATSSLVTIHISLSNWLECNSLCEVKVDVDLLVQLKEKKPKTF
jgi:hypothetical protein